MQKSRYVNFSDKSQEHKWGSLHLCHVQCIEECLWHNPYFKWSCCIATFFPGIACFFPHIYFNYNKLQSSFWTSGLPFIPPAFPSQIYSGGCRRRRQENLAFLPSTSLLHIATVALVYLELKICIWEHLMKSLCGPNIHIIYIKLVFFKYVYKQTLIPSKRIAG